MIIPESLKNEYELEFSFNGNNNEECMFVDKEITNKLINTTSCFRDKINKKKKEEISKLVNLELCYNDNNNKKEYDLIYKLQLGSVWEREDEKHNFFDFSK